MTDIRITAGFMPLTDSVLLVVAREKGFAAAENIDLTLVRETSWANIRDRIAVGHFDVAHMLAPMPIASALGLTPIPAPVIAPMALGLGGNAVTVSLALWQRLVEAGASDNLDPASVGKALAKIAKAEKKLRFGVVHPHSSHNYELRYWLAASGLTPGADIEIVIVPPPLMADALAAGGIDGYCVGEPWNSVGVASGAGRIATVKARIWRTSPEKVLGASQIWADRNPQSLSALLRAVHAASNWCGQAEHHQEAASILSAKSYLGVGADIVLRALSGQIECAKGAVTPVSDFFVPHAHAATFPFTSHALWFYSQMVRWGDVAHDAQNARAAAASYRPDLYRAAIAGAPAEDFRAPEIFFDGQRFEAGKLDAYLAARRP